MSILFRGQAYPTPTRASSSAFQPARQGRREANFSVISCYAPKQLRPSVPSHPNPMQTLTDGLRPSLCYCMQIPRSCSYLISPTRCVVATCCGLDHAHPTLELDTHPGLATHIQENRAAYEDDESRVTCIPRAKMSTVSILTRLGHRLRHFCSGRESLHVFNSSWLASLADSTCRHGTKRSTWRPWPGGRVVEVRVAKSGTSILSRSDWPPSQVCVPLGSSIGSPVRCSVTAKSAVSGGPNNQRPSDLGWLVRPAWPGSPIRTMRSHDVRSGKVARSEAPYRNFRMHVPALHATDLQKGCFMGKFRANHKFHRT